MKAPVASRHHSQAAQQLRSENKLPVAVAGTHSAVAPLKGADLAAARDLLARNYQEMGYLPQGASTDRLLPASAVTIGLKLNDAVVATLSLVGPDARKLPAAQIFAPELNALASKGLTTGEVIGLAIEPKFRKRPTVVAMPLTQSLLQFVERSSKLDAVAITVHPHHASFYVNRLGFEQLGDVREHPKVQNAPAVLLVRRFDRVTEDSQPANKPWQPV